MDQFVVPQFIDVEDKIFGPVTTRQFLILLTGGLFVFISYKLADTVLFIFLLALIGGASLVLAFVKINGQPFHFFLLNIAQTMRRPGLRVWNKLYTTGELNELRKTMPETSAPETGSVRAISYSRLRDLALVVNTGGLYKPD